ncbi:MAG TPA: hypothetical protein VGY99_12125 [Candidatus Binataceae bacterium]|jgi:hypothetical protein|nr:hypothetical protein [Candidatus Binataceae bacterium]
MERKGTAEMLGEFSREVALLVLVFVPLEFFLQAGDQYRWPGTIAAVIFAGMLLSIGIIVERVRRG